jgi:hypothetical protein
MRMSMITGNRETVYDLAPVGKHTARELLAMLKEGKSTGWTLEPGDMTRYGLVLTPLEGRRDLCQAVGGGVGDGQDFILVTYTGGLDMGHGSQVVTKWAHPSHLHGALTANDHTARILAGFMRMVWHLLDHPDVDPRTFFMEEDAKVLLP